jgi:CRISPR/Cas system-associated exonuclease Cas4 (RecB family)
MSELVKASCSSMSDEHAVNVMRSLGGYTAVIRSYIEQELEAYKGNPRIEPILDLIHSSLLTSISDIRSKVQLMLGRMNLDGMGVPMPKHPAANSVKQRGPLPYGIHPEVDMYVPGLHWRGRADLLILTDSFCELVDFKTGEHNERHEFQMRTYALLWCKDSVLNPGSRPVDKLTLSYLHESVDVSVPAGHSLGTFEHEIIERTNKCANTLSITPPTPRPDTDKCVYCDVRHLCERYWKINIGNGLAPEKARNDFTDVEVTLTDQHSLLSWNVIMHAGPYLEPGSSALLRIPMNHYLVQCAQPKSRLRILDTGVFVDFNQEPGTVVFTLNNISEVYFVEHG